MSKTGLKKLQIEVVRCTKCPRLVAWREQVAEERVRRFADETYWGKPAPGFGDPDARMLIVGHEQSRDRAGTHLQVPRKQIQPATAQASMIRTTAKDSTRRLLIR